MGAHDLQENPNIIIGECMGVLCLLKDRIVSASAKWPWNTNSNVATFHWKYYWTICYSDSNGHSLEYRLETERPVTEFNLYLKNL